MATVTDATAVAATRDVLSYLSHYRGKLFVLRIEDDLLSAPLFPMLIKDIVLLQHMGIHSVLVPGARHAIDAALAEPGAASATGADPATHPDAGPDAGTGPDAGQGARRPAPPVDVGSRRITAAADLKGVLAGATTVVNELFSLLTESGARAAVGNWVRARTVGVVDGVDYQRTGRVERVDTDPLRALLETGVIPIVSNIGWNAVGKAYNISSLELVVAVARALQAAKVFLVGTVPGIAVVPCAGVELATRPDGIYSSVDYREAERLLEQCGEQLSADDRALIGAAINACSGGVDRVHVVDGRRDGILIDEIFSADGVGTMFYADQYIDIVPARAADVPEIMRLLQPQVDAGSLVSRTAAEVADRLDDYSVYHVDDTVQGCAALRMVDAATAEIESLVVSETYRGSGNGARLVTYLMGRARTRGARQVLVLTTQSADFFMELGFVEADPDALPGTRPRNYDRNRNSRVLEAAL